MAKAETTEEREGVPGEITSKGPTRLEDKLARERDTAPDAESLGPPDGSGPAQPQTSVITDQEGPRLAYMAAPGCGQASLLSGSSCPHYRAGSLDQVGEGTRPVIY